MKIAIVLPVRRAERTLRATVASLVSQVGSLDAEVIVTVCELDPCVAMVRELRSNASLRVVITPGLRSIPQLRRDAVAATGAEFVVITEDHCTFPPGWLSRLVAEAERGAIAGAGVLNGRTSWVGWAQYFTRYSSFLPPLPAGPIDHLPGTNACYPRAVFERYGHLIEDGFWEAEFNAGARKTTPLVSVEDCDVTQHQDRGAFEFVALRFRHGRCYGARRQDRHWGRVPLIPAILCWRAARAVFGKRRHGWRLLAVSPLVLLYFCAWAAGEAVGYALGAGSACSDTD